MIITAALRGQLSLIIAALLLAACFTACSKKQSKNQMTVYKNVNGYTFHNGELAEFSAIAFKEGKIVDVAFERELSVDTASARVIDGNGKSMLPGLTDAHGHIMGLGFQEISLDVGGISSLDSTLKKIKLFAENNPDRNWIRGGGWNQVIWQLGRFPTAAELDKAVDERPVWLTRVDGHAGWANTKAMEKAGITKETQAPEGGKIIRDDNGNPTGVFVDAAQSLISSAIPDYTDEEQNIALTKALQKIRANGLTSVHNAGIYASTWKLYKEFADKNKLTVRINAMIRGA